MKTTMILVLVGLGLGNVIPVLAIDNSAEAFMGGGYYNRLIEDSEFVDYNSMNTASIQQFLENRSSYLAIYTQGGKSAAQIIWEAAMGISPDSQGTLNGIVIDQTTGTINPMAILVTLQKEQSLIGKSYYDEHALNWAMGYGAYGSYLGFTAQIGWGAWQLRYNFERAVKDWAATYHVGQSDWYDSPYGNINVTYSNQATASLYRYTPHIFDGNYNFWSFYHDWFYKISEVKLKNDGTAINLFHKPVVYAASDYFYIEEKDRTCGLRVARANHGLSAGMCADVYGAIYTNPYGERYVSAEAVVQNGNAIIGAMFMNNRSVGGGNWEYNPATGSGQRGFPGLTGLNNIGLKITIAGRVSGVNLGTRTFYLQDSLGSVKVNLPPSVAMPANGNFISVTGISSSMVEQNLRIPWVLGVSVTLY